MILPHPIFVVVDSEFCSLKPVLQEHVRKLFCHFCHHWKVVCSIQSRPLCWNVLRRLTSAFESNIAKASLLSGFVPRLFKEAVATSLTKLALMQIVSKQQPPQQNLQAGVNLTISLYTAREGCAAPTVKLFFFFRVWPSLSGNFQSACSLICQVRPVRFTTAFSSGVLHGIIGSLTGTILGFFSRTSLIDSIYGLSILDSATFDAISQGRCNHHKFPKDT